MSFLQDLGAVFASIPFQWKLAGLCLSIASWFPANKDKFLLNYWTGCLGAFGGGTLSALMLQGVPGASLALFDSNIVGAIWTASWWLMNYSPNNIGWRVHNLLPVRMVTKMGMNMLRAGVIAQRIDVSESQYPGVIAAALFIGTISATGGKLLVDLIQQLTGKLKGNSEIAEPGFPIRSGFFGSLLYWTSVYGMGWLKPSEGAALVIAILVAHGVLSDLSGRPLDFTYPIAKAAHTLTLIPMPGQPANTAAKASPAAKASSAKKVA